MVTTRSTPSTPSSPQGKTITLHAPPAITVRRTGNAVAITKPWSHTPSHLTLFWLAVSLPLVLWDTGYVLLRPHSMPGGALHAPIWTPYELYGSVDHFYGWPAYNEQDGFTAAQSALNAVETLGYVVYLWIVWEYGRQEGSRGRGAPEPESVGALGRARTVRGRMAAWAVLIGFGAALMTLSKTVLYWLNEYFSGFKHIGHNDLWSLIFLWIIPNGAWIAFPSYITYVFGAEILQGLESATGEPKKRA